MKSRSARDFARLRAYADHLDADVIAFQEVDGPQAAARVFDPSRYTLVLSGEDIVQRVGIAVRRGLPVTLNGEVTGFDLPVPGDPHHLRYGLDVTVGAGKDRLRLLVVHLKSGCWDQPLAERGHSCPILYRQFETLDDWVLERQDEGDAYAVLGDFNRRLTEKDPLMVRLDSDAPLTLTTSGWASPCWGEKYSRGEYFIDHILLGNAARNWLVPGSLRVMTYRGDASPEGLSDHCPVSVRLDLP